MTNNIHANHVAHMNATTTASSKVKGQSVFSLIQQNSVNLKEGLKAHMRITKESSSQISSRLVLTANSALAVNR